MSVKPRDQNQESPRRLVILGDIGGQLEPYIQQMIQLGADLDSMLIPEDLVVVQLGDLVSMTGATTHQNKAVVDIARGFQQTNPCNYFQLCGNHDLAAVGGVRRESWGEASSPALQNSIMSTAFLSAVGVERSNAKPLLLTHAGVTRGAWKAMGSPELPELVRRLNTRTLGERLESQRAGSLVTGVMTSTADEQWAEVNFELYAPWLAGATFMPWEQVHGHASPWAWRADAWWPDTPTEIRNRTTLDHNSRISNTSANVCVFQSVNWELTDLDSDASVNPLVIDLSLGDKLFTV